MGMRIREATVWEMKVATLQEKRRMMTKASQGESKGKPIEISSNKRITYSQFVYQIYPFLTLGDDIRQVAQ